MGMAKKITTDMNTCERTWRLVDDRRGRCAGRRIQGARGRGTHTRLTAKARERRLETWKNGREGFKAKTNIWRCRGGT